MRNRRFMVLINISLLLLAAAFLTTSSWAQEEEMTDRNSTVGVIDLEHIKKVAPRFIQLRTETEEDQRELAEFIAQVLTQHQRKIREMTNNKSDFEAGEQAATSSGQESFYLRTQELAAETQQQIDGKKREIEKRQEEREAAVYEEFHAVLAKVAKDKNLECILLKGGFQVGGNDVTEQVLKTWKKWGLTFWQRVKLFFTGSAGKPELEQAEATASGQ
ncbi:MAG: OmpH family outer membrane protein [Firmicutes bacterium]|nr:OmpH family outer membrane protein [Bacillota bacterium]